jgi:hypothetical protein
MDKPNRTFEYRTFAAIGMVLSGLALPVTGIANHFFACTPPSVGSHAWMSAHNALGILFVVFSIWHVALNRMALWKHLRNAASRIPGMSREALLAGAVVTLTLVLFVGHAFHAGH